MWQCPKCKREFKNINQDHYCGEKPKSIDEYILRQSKEKQAALAHLRQVLASALPEAEERISWSMPTFWQGHNIVHFAAAKAHIGFFPGAEAVAHFSSELAAYKTNKGTIHIPYDNINDDLIRNIAVWCGEAITALKK